MPIETLCMRPGPRNVSHCIVYYHNQFHTLKFLLCSGILSGIGRTWSGAEASWEGLSFICVSSIAPITSLLHIIIVFITSSKLGGIITPILQVS